MRRSLASVVLVGFAAVGCASAPHARPVATSAEPVTAEVADGASSGAPPTASAAPEVTRSPGPLTRPEVEALVARGLGFVLARIEVAPVLDAGHFVGFRLVHAMDLEAWHGAGLDVQLGDVVVRINGQRIERPEQALWAFERLRIAPAIAIDLVRAGHPMRVRSPIVDPTAAASREQ